MISETVMMTMAMVAVRDRIAMRVRSERVATSSPASSTWRSYPAAKPLTTA